MNITDDYILCNGLVLRDATYPQISSEIFRLMTAQARLKRSAKKQRSASILKQADAMLTLATALQAYLQSRVAADSKPRTARSARL